jgi:phage/plasmid-associated DNA primase
MPANDSTYLWGNVAARVWLRTLGKNGSTRLRVFEHNKEKPQKHALDSLKKSGDLWYKEGHRVYAVVNEGGDDKASINRCVALFAEHDDLAKQLPQFADFDKKTADDATYLAYAEANKHLSTELIDALVTEGKIPRPTMCVDTGGKSLHWYWRLVPDSCSPSMWTDLQGRLLAAVDSDPSVKDLCRLMRLPGFKHERTGLPVKIVRTWGNLDEDLNVVPFCYTAQQLNKLLPQTDADSSPTKKVHPLDRGERPGKARPASKHRWFDLLSTASQDKCIAEMIKKIVEVHGPDGDRGCPRHNVRMEFLPGVFRHYANRTAEEHYTYLQKFFEWHSDTYPGFSGFKSWLLNLKVQGYASDAITIATTIRFAKSCGFDSRDYIQEAGIGEQSIAAIVADQVYGISSPEDRHIITLSTWATYELVPGQYYYQLMSDKDMEATVSGWIYKNAPKQLRAIKPVVECIKQLTYKDAKVAPDGYVLCTNGVLKVEPGKHTLLEYTNPEVRDMVFLNAPGVTYNPNADRSHAHNILGGLENDEAKEVYLRVAAQALNTRCIPGTPVALLNLGEGGNGKDVCADVLKHIFGLDSVTDIDISDLVKVNDASQGNGTLALLPLMHARLNLPSETSTKTKLDHVPALKQVITMERMKARGHCASFENFNPRAIHMFSINEAVLADSNSAMNRRFRAVRWPYQYKFPQEIDTSNPMHRPAVAWYRPLASDTAGQKRIQEEVCPGFLLELLEAFDRLTGAAPSQYGSGMPQEYSQWVRAQMRSDTDHVKCFLMEMGFSTSSSTYSKYSVSVSDMWLLYRLWCLHNLRAEAVKNYSANLNEGEPEYTIKVLREDKDACLSASALTRRIHSAQGWTTGKVGSNKYGLPATNYWKSVQIPEEYRDENGRLKNLGYS